VAEPLPHPHGIQAPGRCIVVCIDILNFNSQEDSTINSNVEFLAKGFGKDGGDVVGPVVSEVLDTA